MYWPDALAVGGSVLGPIRRKLDTLQLTPCSSASSPRYAPQGQTATAISTGLSRG